MSHQVDIDTVEKFEELRKQEQQYFTDMVQLCKDSGAGLVVCQWGFDDEANHLLMHKVRLVLETEGGIGGEAGRCRVVGCCAEGAGCSALRLQLVAKECILRQ